MENLLNNESSRAALVAAVVFVAVALLLLVLGIAVRAMRQGRNLKVVDRAVAAREGRSAQTAIQAQAAAGRLEAAKMKAESLGASLGRGRFGDSLLDLEDRRLIDLCGFRNQARARSLFTLTRAVLALALPAIAWLTLKHSSGHTQLVSIFIGFGLGWMLPKWFLARAANHRRLSAIEELPLLIDLLRLLQGVGLSMDQSLHVVVNEFASVLPVLSRELGVSTEQYARGRTREQSLARLMNSFASDDLNSICRLIVQVDKHGGAVQDPLTRFGDRVRERRKLELREKVARTTVKMTGVMVLTLLPALLIITGGSGLLSVVRGLSKIGGHG